MGSPEFNNVTILKETLSLCGYDYSPNIKFHDIFLQNIIFAIAS
jgi:hypothetical protein